MEPITGWRRLLNEPQLIASGVRAVVFAAMTFGVAVTQEQLAATMGALEIILMLANRALATPNQLAEARVDAGKRPTDNSKPS